ncbi:hypothetical protein BM221_001719 [Beauveria bassiana]|uniref:Beta-lactamase-related domain-containing protein n=1 Tax=Beauveria bassiana TaxID=176275 RepID=A0A2N6NWH4_BEABA|nr:hypothetical protein BM221_001719 [Beauveria bassiana]
MKSDAIVQRLSAALPIIRKVCKISGVPAASIGVIHQGQSIYVENIGHRNVEAQLSPTADTLYGLGSLTKGFVAASLAQLLHNHPTVTWTTPLQDIWPEFGEGDDADCDQNQDSNEDNDEDTIEDVEEDVLMAEGREELEGLKRPQTQTQSLKRCWSESTEQPAEDVDDEDFSGEDGDLEPKHKFLVSSHILRLTSPIFRRDLDPNGPWRQPEIQPDGLQHRYLESFNPEAFKHVLNVIHFRNNQVPYKLELEELAEVAVIVDYLQCHESMRFAVKFWIGKKRIKEVVNNAKPGRPLILWLVIASVFGIDAIRNAAAKTIIEHNEGLFDSMGLPIAEDITCEFYINMCDFDTVVSREC